MAPRCCQNDSHRRKVDLSRAPVAAVPGRPAAAGNDRPGPPDPARSGGSLAASGPVSSGGGTPLRSRPAPDSKTGRCRTPPRNPTLGKTTVATRLLGPSHPGREWTTAACRDTLTLLMLWSRPLTGAAINKTPIARTIGVFPFSALLYLTKASASLRR